MTELTNNVESTNTNDTQETVAMTLDQTIESGNFDNMNMFTNAEIRERVDQINEDMGTEVFSLRKKAPKRELVEALQVFSNINSTGAGEAYAQGTSEYAQISLDQIEICPLNARHPLDYHDVVLQDSIRRAGGLTKDLVLVHASALGSSFEDKFFVIAGNRSYANLVEVLKQEGNDPSETSVQCKIRTFVGHDLEVKNQIMAELMQDNASVVENTSIDKLNFIKTQLAMGKKQVQIAADMGLTQPRVNTLLSLDQLPQMWKDHIHFGAQAKLLSRKSTSELDEYGVLYTETLDEMTGEVGIEVHGIPAELGMKLVRHMRKINKKPTRKHENYSEAMEEWNDNNDRMNQILCDERSISIATTMSVPAALKAFKETLAQYGFKMPVKAAPVVEEVEEVVAAPVVEEVEPQDEMALVEEIMEEIQESSTPEPESGLMALLKEDPNAFASMFGSKINTVGQELEDVVADGIRNKKPAVLNFVRFLIRQEIIQDVTG